MDVVTELGYKVEQNFKLCRDRLDLCVGVPPELSCTNPVHEALTVKQTIRVREVILCWCRLQMEVLFFPVRGEKLLDKSENMCFPDRTLLCVCYDEEKKRDFTIR